MNIGLKQYQQLLVTYLAPQRTKVLALAALLLASIALQIANPQLLRYFIDTAQSPQSELRSLFIAAALFMAGRRRSSGSSASTCVATLPEPAFG